MNMRIAVTVALLVSAIPHAILSQTPTTAAAPSDVWVSDARWGDDKQTFDVRLGIQGVEATFTVATNGFGWHRTFTNVKETFNRWGAVVAWCSAPGTLLFRTQQQTDPRLGVFDVRPDDLATIVDGYFKKYASEAEWSGPEWECTPATFRGPKPTDLARIRELLESASSEQR